MVSLLFALKIPLISEFLNYIWQQPPLSPEYCLEDVFNFDAKYDCYKSLIVKSLGLAMILGAFLNKAPVLMNVLSTQSVAGFSKYALYSEIVVYSNGFFYGVLQEGLPFTSYGENAALLIQTVVLILCYWNYNSSSTSFMEPIIVLALYGLYAYSVLFALEDISYLMKTLVPINLYAKGIQIITIFQEGHTGNQSIVTLTMNVVGTTIRVGTTLGEATIDTNLLLCHVSSAILNLIIYSQYFYYAQATRQFWDEKKKKKTE
eukprot:CAMPEP_0194136418 /NCGR_PEP_ID=MMETSP0152-20130528/6436_1 /TAXON_ID=1049557 /ORGANISM="Thalassiothrix antarctica, Strain L6-D1" /LENGTH=260 /DNA_ID=CAMNT_0038833065 /DNA_START=104 /DNA_END=886 /DNA_ORIENTATION=+